MKENYQIYLPNQFHWRLQSLDEDSQLSHKKMKTMFLSNMSESRRLTSSFFPIKIGTISLTIPQLKSSPSFIIGDLGSDDYQKGKARGSSSVIMVALIAEEKNWIEYVIDVSCEVSRGGRLG